MWWAELALTMTGASNFPVVFERQVSKTTSFQETTLKFQDLKRWAWACMGDHGGVKDGVEQVGA